MRKNLGVIGEALVDVVMSDTAETRSLPGGSPLNVAVGLARLGEEVLFAGRYGADSNGQIIERHLRDNKVIPLLRPDHEPTSVAKAILDPTGAATYEFELSWTLPEEALDSGLGESLLHLHAGSIGTVLEPGATTVTNTLKRLHSSATISYDPNCRPTVLPNRYDYRARAEGIVVMADIVHASEEDLEWLYPERSVEETLSEWQGAGPALVVLTRGPFSILAATAHGMIEEPIVPVEVSDTVGAGDSFTAALLVALKDRDFLGIEQRSALHTISEQAAREVVQIAAHASAVTSSRTGANPPTREELQLALQEHQGK